MFGFLKRQKKENEQDGVNSKENIGIENDLEEPIQEERMEENKLDEKRIEEIKKEAEKMSTEDIKKHEQYYSTEELWKKIKLYSKKAGTSVVYVVLLLYYTLQKPEVPIRVKATIVGALGYFIFPIELIPDLVLGVGYVDDLSLLMAALLQVALYIDEDVKNQAKEKLRDLFGDDDIDTTEIDQKLT